jgi:signal transduction histidine kinase
VSRLAAIDRRDWLVILGVALIGLAALLGGWWLAEWRIRATVSTYALSVAERVTEATAEILDPSDPKNAGGTDPRLRDAVLQLLERTAGVVRMVGFDRDRIVWFDSTGRATGTPYDEADVAEVFDHNAPLTLLHLSGPEYHVLGLERAESAIAEIYVPVRRGGAIVGAFELYIDATEILSGAIDVARIAYAVFSGTILAAIAAILILVGRSLSHRRNDLLAIDDLRRKAEAVSAELAETNRRQERFNADAAHELRTPLAILRARLDAMPASGDVQALKEDVDRMIRQVQLLLELARTESAATHPESQLDLAHLAQDMAARLYPMARRMGREIVVEAPEHPVEITGDPALVDSALRNLLENALRVSPLGATVHLVVTDAPPRLAVADHGPGLDHGELSGLLEPFRRGPRGGSAGLGLAIVAEAAKRLRAQLALDRTDAEGGATFSLTFPR